MEARTSRDSKRRFWTLGRLDLRKNSLHIARSSLLIWQNGLVWLCPRLFSITLREVLICARFPRHMRRKALT
jgi:hypothetical protein